MVGLHARHREPEGWFAGGSAVNLLMVMAGLSFLAVMASAVLYMAGFHGLGIPHPAAWFRPKGFGMTAFLFLSGL